MSLHRTGIATFLLGTLLACGAPQESAAEVSVGVSVNIGPPPIVAAEPPEVVLVPNSQVYFVPGVAFDVFYCNGWWWSPRGDRWYRSRLYNGPWRIIDRGFVPGPVMHVPHDSRNVYVRERHIPYREWRERHLRPEHREIMEHHERERDHREMREEHGEHGHGGEHER